MSDEALKSRTAKNWSLILGLAIPVLMILFIAVSIYVPQLFDNTPPPSVNFLYTSDYTHPHSLQVRKNRLEWVKGHTYNEQQDKAYASKPVIYVHDVKTNTSKSIDFEEAQNLLLDAKAIAPDGYKIEQSRRNGWFPFDYHYSRDRYLVNAHAAHKLNLEYTNQSYYGFNFLGWVIE
ncbi:MAG: hypothetical protein HKN88_05090 [Gammaproteobacteria bacterium]|nr:hypothetical protein [Gammaproteobacteria bacterium]